MTEPEYYLITPEEFRKFYECALIHDMPDAPTIGAFIRSRAAKGESEAVLDKLGKMLNKRIAKMEVLDSQNPSQLRKGILMAYREIEEWERQQQRERAHEKG